MGLRAELLFGVTLLGSAGSAGAGGFVDLPSLEASLKTVAGDASCNAISNTTSLSSNANANKNASQPVRQSFPRLLNIVPKAVIDVGVEAHASIAVEGLQTAGIVTTTTLARTTISLPTACWSFDGGRSAFLEPGAKATATATTSVGASASVSRTSGVASATGGAKGSGNGTAALTTFTGSGTQISLDGWAVRWVGGLMAGILGFVLVL